MRYFACKPEILAHSIIDNYGDRHGMCMRKQLERKVPVVQGSPGPQHPNQSPQLPVRQLQLSLTSEITPVED